MCRLSNQEASLLPFQKNTFTIHTAERFASILHPTFQTFLDLLIPEQRQALAHLTVSSTSCLLASNKGQIARLTGLRSLHIIQMPDAGLAPVYESLVSTWEHSGGKLREWRRVEMRHLKSVRLSMEVRFSSNKALRAAEEAVLSVQTPDLTKMLGIMEAKLFQSLAKRPMRAVAEGGECFEGRLSEMPFLK